MAENGHLRYSNDFEFNLMINNLIENPLVVLAWKPIRSLPTREFKFADDESKS